MLDPFRVYPRGHLAAFVIDAEQELIIFVCTQCGAHSDPAEAGRSLPIGFGGVPHTANCFAMAAFRVAYKRSEAA